MKSFDFLFNVSNPSSRTIAMGFTQPLTEMSTRDVTEGKGRPARNADNLTAVYEPIVWKWWNSRYLNLMDHHVLLQG
jgi:hypothetical protein